jgi:hypothetical protein
MSKTMSIKDLLVVVVGMEVGTDSVLDSVRNGFISGPQCLLQRLITGKSLGFTRLYIDRWYWLTAAPWMVKPV